MVTTVPTISNALLECFRALFGEAFQSVCLACRSRTNALLCQECCALPLLDPLGRDQIHSAILYRDPWRKVLHGVKFQRRRAWLREFKPVFRNDLLPRLSEGTAVIPVPVHRSTLLHRGFNQSELLARMFCRATGLPLYADLLIKKKKTPPQSSLNARQRKTNVRRVFGVRDGHLPPTAVLIDDVLTTGSTLRECKAALQKAGCANVTAWTLFRSHPSEEHTRL
jgi:competence protein ComFC